jgi:hypothetical protein
VLLAALAAGSSLQAAHRRRVSWQEALKAFFAFAALMLQSVACRTAAAQRQQQQQ